MCSDGQLPGDGSTRSRNPSDITAFQCLSLSPFRSSDRADTLTVRNGGHKHET